MASSKTQKILRYALYGAIGVGVLGVVGYVLIIRPLQIRAQKQNFVKAEASLEALASQIQNTVGKADETKKEKSCGYASRVYTKGPRSCAVNFDLLFKSKNLADSNNSMLALATQSGGKLRYYLGDNNSQGNPYPQKFVEYSGRGPSQKFSQDIISYGSVTCSSSYVYPVVPLFDKEFMDPSNENFEIILACSGPALAEFYPSK